MKKITTNIRIGIDKPLRLIHFSDTHLTRADGRDDERKINLAKKRRSGPFPDNEQIFEETLKIASQGYDAVLHTGDLMDFVSYANLEAAKEFADKTGCFFAAGNHDFSLYVGEAKEDAAYRAQSLDKVNAVFDNDIRFDSQVIGGVNFIAIDDSYYLFEAYQLEGLKREAAKGLPMILLMHNPLYERSLYDRQISHNPCAYLTGVPEELMVSYDSHRFEQQRADKITLETIEYIKSEPLIKAVLAGHVHCDFESELRPGLPQYSVGLRTARELIIE